MATTVKCPSCGRDSTGARFCGWCAAALDATSVETMGGLAVKAQDKDKK